MSVAAIEFVIFSINAAIGEVYGSQSHRNYSHAHTQRITILFLKYIRMAGDKIIDLFSI
jgi:hypothetical protein